MSRRISPPFKRSSIRSKQDIDVIKKLKEIDRGVERLKLFMSTDKFDPDKLLSEKKTIVERLTNRLDECKNLIDQKNVSSEVIDMYFIRYCAFKEKIEDNNLLMVQVYYEEEKERQKDICDNIISLSQNVAHINEMFNDIQMMIEKQGENIDKIEKNVNETNIKVEKGIENIKDAEGIQDKGFKAKLITGIFVVVSVIGTVIGINRF